MQPLDQSKRDRRPLWAPERARLPAPGSLEHCDEGGEMPIRTPEKPPGSHVVEIDIS